MIKSTVTSKGQVTIPKVVRDYLGLMTGDILLFKLHPGGEVLIVNERKIIVCPVCYGSGQVEEIECVVCNSSGALPLERENALVQLLAISHHLIKQYSIFLKPLFSRELLSQKEQIEVGEGLSFRIVSEIIPHQVVTRFNQYFTEEFEHGNRKHLL